MPAHTVHPSLEVSAVSLVSHLLELLRHEAPLSVVRLRAGGKQGGCQNTPALGGLAYAASKSCSNTPPPLHCKCFVCWVSVSARIPQCAHVKHLFLPSPPHCHCHTLDCDTAHPSAISLQPTSLQSPAHCPAHRTPLFIPVPASLVTDKRSAKSPLSPLRIAQPTPHLAVAAVLGAVHVLDVDGEQRVWDPAILCEKVWGKEGKLWAEGDGCDASACSSSHKTDITAACCNPQSCVLSGM